MRLGGKANTKERTFISHLNETKWNKDAMAYNPDGSKSKVSALKKKMDARAEPNKKKNMDQKQD